MKPSDKESVDLQTIKDSIADKWLLEATEKLNRWIECNGWAGFDRWDIWGHPLILRLLSLPTNALITQKVFRRLMFGMISRMPLTTRRILGVKKEINAKAMGLFAIGYLNLYKALKERGCLEKAEECLGWLIRNSSPGYTGYCWGYPFHWQSRVFIPKGTPSGVVTSVVGNAFWSYYQMTDERKYLDICKSICDFFINDLNKHWIGGDKLCFSYTPVDYFRVHNANLFVADFLIKVGSTLNLNKYIEYGEKALNYSLSEQNHDGSFYYWGLPDNNSSRYIPPPPEILYTIDHYHTGFVLRALYSIHQVTQNSRLLEALKKGYDYYIKNLFEDGVIPKLLPGEKYPIDIHSCSEAILAPSILSDIFPGAFDIAMKAARWTIENMQDDKGFFYYQILPERRILVFRDRTKIKTPYVRWGQAWMFYALSVLLYKATRETLDSSY